MTDPNEEEFFPRDFELPFESNDEAFADDVSDTTPSSGMSFLLTGSGDLPKKGISLSREESLVISSTISLYSSYVEYVRETNPELHKRALAYSSETVDLHPNVVLIDEDGNPIGRLSDSEDEG